MYKARKFFALLFTLPVLWLFFNHSANWHYHQSQCGQLVRHAHPYQHSGTQDTSPLTPHQHTEAEFLALSLLCGAENITPADTGNSFVSYELPQEVTFSITQKQACSPFLHHHGLRGPPVPPSMNC